MMETKTMHIDASRETVESLINNSSKTIENLYAKVKADNGMLNRCDDQVSAVLKLKLELIRDIRFVLIDLLTSLRACLNATSTFEKCYHIKDLEGIRVEGYQLLCGYSKEKEDAIWTRIGAEIQRCQEETREERFAKVYEGLVAVYGQITETFKNIAAYVNAFSFIDMYKSVIGKSHAELLEIFKSGIVKYISTHEIDRMEGTGLEMVAQDIPAKTKEFYDFLQQKLHHKWTEKQNQGLEEMVEAFKTDVPKFCSMFSENEHGVTFHYITESVLQNVPEDLVEQRMLTLNPKDVHELAKLVNRRYIPQDIYSFHLQKEKGFVAAMKRGIEMIDGEDTVSKVEAKTVLLYQVDKALGNFEIAK